MWSIADGSKAKWRIACQPESHFPKQVREDFGRIGSMNCLGYEIENVGVTKKKI